MYIGLHYILFHHICKPVKSRLTLWCVFWSPSICQHSAVASVGEHCVRSEKAFTQFFFSYTEMYGSPFNSVISYYVNYNLENNVMG